MITCSLISNVDYHTLALTDNGEVWSWGRSESDILGHDKSKMGDKYDPSVPQVHLLIRSFRE
jgi:alpha-tubulin suppressor-like RCC1 family protein